MDMQRAFLAIIISFIILIGYQSYFMPQAPPVVPGQGSTTGNTTENTVENTAGNATGNVVVPTGGTQGGQISQVNQAEQAARVQPVAVDPKARDIIVETPLYTAVFSEQGGGLKSFVLKKYRIAKEEDAPFMEMISTTNPAELPMIFSLDNGAGGDLPFLEAETTFVQVNEGETGELTMTAVQADGIRIERHLTFTSTTYLIDSKYVVSNTGSVPLQISPAMVMTNGPFASGSTSSRYMFSGPAVYVNGKLEQIKPKNMVEGSYPLQGQVRWAAHV
ncbi:MAG: membrane protein insertase YidC, partial [Candidatus Electrothrix sp. AUS3]|nr:membrane protein insertase YidC [Candidatus Electrothrix gigas]